MERAPALPFVAEAVATGRERRRLARKREPAVIGWLGRARAVEHFASERDRGIRAIALSGCRNAIPIDI
eukprot:4294037-Prymnesium_polylepis.1